ncbi:MAG: RNA-binding protein [Deltaproteobacteria bacterium]|nr:RNA-binding protein [Deltaproteobacteria bacterium]
MFKKIFVGNLSYQTSEDELKELFGQHGDVQSVKIIVDRDSGRSRGFGFIEMEEAQALTAIDAVNGYEFMGRNLRVNEANERTGNRGNRGRFGNRSYGGNRDHSDRFDDGY